MLDEDNVTDLTPVANLKKLERLSLKKSSVKSLAPLSQIKTLKFLYIADTPITDTPKWTKRTFQQLRDLAFPEDRRIDTLEHEVWRKLARGK